jgi:DNA-binding Xre family transcriptional regulator
VDQAVNQAIHQTVNQVIDKPDYRPDHTSDYTTVLRSHMQRAHIASYRALATQAQVSRWQVQQLRKGKLRQMRLAAVAQLADALQLSVGELLSQFGGRVN